MIFECRDLERALANQDLMVEAHRHFRECETCRNEYQIWNEISATAKQLHYEWDSPDLWPSIRRTIEAERKAPNPWWTEWRLWATISVAAAVVLIAIVSLPQRIDHRVPATNVESQTLADQDFLTEQALKDVERNEAVYRSSIEQLSRLARPKLDNRTSSPLFASYREKLLMLDSAILETKSNVVQNQFNVHLQAELADLYREKRQTLQEVLTHAQKN